MAVVPRKPGKYGTHQVQFQVVTRTVTKDYVDKIHSKNVQFQGLIYFKMLLAALLLEKQRI